MPACRLDIELFTDQTVQSPDGQHARPACVAGSELRGQITVEPEDHVNCKGVLVSVGWETEGRGDTDHDVVWQDNLYRGPLSGGHAEFLDFSCTLPDGPITYHGHYITIQWFVKAQIDIPWAVDPRQQVSFVLVPRLVTRPR